MSGGWTTPIDPVKLRSDVYKLAHTLKGNHTRLTSEALQLAADEIGSRLVPKLSAHEVFCITQNLTSSVARQAALNSRAGPQNGRPGPQEGPGHVEQAEATVASAAAPVEAQAAAPAETLVSSTNAFDPDHGTTTITVADDPGEAVKEKGFVARYKRWCSTHTFMADDKLISAMCGVDPSAPGYARARLKDAGYRFEKELNGWLVISPREAKKRELEAKIEQVKAETTRMLADLQAQIKALEESDATA